MRKVLLSLSLFCAATYAAQAVTVTGTVQDDSGALPGASVMIKGTDEGTEADDKGNFSLEVKPGDVLEIEYLGYVTQTYTIPAKPKKIKIVMKEDGVEEIKLDVKVVTTQPYGGTGGVVGASTTLGTKALESATGASVDNALQGRVPGVTANSTSGQPGASANVRIHGTSTLTGDGTPLYVVDGMPLGGGTEKSASSNPLASINPADIESMEVLKDASATAIYGSRAANGVIIITTKKGKNGDAKITYNGNVSLSQFTNRYDMMNLQEYARFVNDKHIIQERGTTPDLYYADPKVLGEGTDWQDELFQSAFGHSHQLSVNGGTEKTQYNISLGYTNQEGVIITSDYERINGRISVESQVKEWLRMGMNVGVSRQNATKIARIIDPKAKQSGASVVGFKETDENIIIQSLLQLPSDSPFNMDGSVSGPETDLGVKMNPIAELKQSPLQREETNILGSTFLDIKIAKNISWRNEFGIDLTTASDHYFQPSYNYGGLNKGTDQASLDEGNYSNNSVRFSSYANYNNTFNKAHKVNFMLGAEANYYNWKGQTANGKGFASNAIPTMNLATTTYVTGYYEGHGSMASFFGRVNYDYNSKYNVSATGRYDGSSNFADGNRWGFFPSIGLAWRISNEDFIKESESLSKAISDLKLRVGYGETGNASCSPSHIAYLSKWQATSGDYDLYHYYNYTNSDLSWETNKQFNVGLNLSLWNRIDVIIDGFYKKNNDLLLKPQLPSYVAPTDGGWTYMNTAYVNAGSIKNTGVDIALHTINIQDSIAKQPFTWDMDFSFSVVRNEVVDLGSSTTAITESSDPSGSYRLFTTDMEINRSEVGQAPGLFYGYKTNGIITNESQLAKYKKSVKDGSRDNAQVGDVWYDSKKSVIGDPNPDFTYGFGTNVAWGPWSLNVQLSGSQGNDVYNLVRQKLEALNDKWVNQTSDCMNFARVNDDKTKVSNSGTSIPRPVYTNDANGNAKTVSDRFVEDGSYLKIQNIGVTYSLPSKYCKNIKIDNLHVSAGVSNVYTFTNYSGYDPENPGSAIRQGVDEGRYPSPRTYSLGLGFSF